MTSGNGYKDREDRARAYRESSESRVEAIADEILAEIPDFECRDERDDWVLSVAAEAKWTHGLTDEQHDYLKDVIRSSGRLPELVS